ncbi:hypothetical protein SB766_02125 [Pseudomonas sp. SIMBA_077]
MGAPNVPLLPTLESPESVDGLIFESTYGNRFHENRLIRQERLESAIGKAMADHGTVLIPAFSLGRTQEWLY